MRHIDSRVALADIPLDGPTRPTVVQPRRIGAATMIGVSLLVLLVGLGAYIVIEPDSVFLLARAVGVR